MGKMVGQPGGLYAWIRAWVVVRWAAKIDLATGTNSAGSATDVDRT